jgi:uncharacterized LabA/DUF88 family protein
MDRVAVFVDAGYLYAQGSTAIDSGKQPRTSLLLNSEKAIELLKELACEKAPKCALLRIYWYDGVATGARLTADQSLLAHLDDVKLRLGFINSHGQQKGVDSLIVTDLIELARQKSICDALLLTGDEDIRVGVQIAQNYGVRVHLLGIHPSRGSQSHQLMQEADTTTEWSSEKVKGFLSLRIGVTKGKKVTDPKIDDVKSPVSPPQTIDTEAALRKNTEMFVTELDVTDLDGITVYWKTERGVPPDIDKRLLPSGRDILGRDLTREEIKLVRAYFREITESRIRDHQEKQSK